jgi:hypothetical protein
MRKFVSNIHSIFLLCLFFPFIGNSQTVLWQNDFSNPASWVIDNSGQSGAEYGWTIDNVSDGWYAPATAIASTSEGNFAELSNGDPTAGFGTQATDVIYTMTTSAPINISALGGNNFVSLQFQQYGARFNDLQEIQVSTDGVNFIAVGSNSYHAVLSASGGSAYPNPETVNINLSQVLPVNPTAVWIRFSWTTEYPSQATNPNVWVTYGWYIDDVKIVTLPNYDLSIENESWGTNGLNYYQIPKSQVQPISFNAKIQNEGQQAMTNVAFQINVNAGGYIGTSPSTTIPILSSDSLWVVYTPPNNVNATYTINRSINSQQVDQNPTNNIFQPITINVNDNIYARDNGIYAGSTSNGTDGFEVGNLYEIVQNQTLGAINTRLLGGTSGTTVGTEIYVKLYSIDPTTGDFVYQSESNPFYITASDINTNLTIPLISPFQLQANTVYLPVVGTYDGGLKVSNAGTSEPLTSFFLDNYDNTWFSQISTPVVQMVMCGASPINQVINESACNSYTSPTGQLYSQSGTYIETIPSSLGCDSVIVTINLTIVNPTQTSFSETICDGDIYTWNNQDYTYSGSFSQTFPAVNGCDSIVTLNLTVNANSPIQIQANPTFGNAPLNVLFNNQTTNLSNYNFTWNFGDGTSQQSNSPFLSHTYTQNGYADVTVFAENTVTGCITSAIFNDMIFVQGGVVCTHTATLNQTGPLSACVGDSVLLSCNTDPSFSYQWNRNGVPVSGATSSSIYVQLGGSYTVTIYQNTCPVTSNGISVTINPLPSIPTITSTGTITSCSGGSLTLSAPAGSSSYSWNTGATTASISVTQSGSYTVTVTNSNGCARTSAPYVVNASFMSSPNVCVVGMDSLTNENRIVWEKPLTLGIDSFYVYKETNVSDVYTKIGATAYNDLAVFLDQNSNPAVQAYRYKLTVLDTCGTETLLSDFHKTIHLTINAGVGGAWNLIWSHYEGLTFGSYNIYRGTDPTNISLLTTIQSNLNSYTDLAPPVGPVYYQIEIVNPNSCDPTKVINYSVSKSNIVNNGVNGINTLANNTVLVYPNPTSKDVTLEITSELLGKDYYLTDNTGRIILSGQFRALKETINLEQISTGVYFIKIDDNANLMYKIVKN